MRFIYLTLPFLFVFFLGCGTSPVDVGSERGPCYGNGTCNAGLVCASNLCVRAPDETDAGNGDATTPFVDDAGISDSGAVGTTDAGLILFEDGFVPDAMVVSDDAAPMATDAVLPRFFNTGVANETFDEALARCRALGMTLPIIHSAAENDELSAFVAAERPSYAWLGIVMTVGSGWGGVDILWVDGTPLTETFWHGGGIGTAGRPPGDNTTAIIDALNRDWSIVFTSARMEFVRTVCQRIG